MYENTKYANYWDQRIVQKFSNNGTVKESAPSMRKKLINRQTSLKS